jgi:3-oxoacyl-(acyl-carrier-protein) synthase
LNAYAFLKSGMLSDFIIGGAEAPLTGFSIEQMRVLKLYSKRKDNFPCRSLDFLKTGNTLVLGEAASLAHLSTVPSKDAIKVAGMGYATEQISHSISLSTDAECLQSSMKMALREADTDSVDAIVMHAPGTVKGDKSELNAIKKVFSKLPLLTTNKWLIGHTFGASGAMSLEMAVMMLRHNQFIPNPFYKNESLPDRLNTVMVNAVGFGGNAISVILKK